MSSPREDVEGIILGMIFEKLPDKLAPNDIHDDLFLECDAFTVKNLQWDCWDLQVQPVCRIIYV